jgi:phage terminase large subunit-like protein
VTRHSSGFAVAISSVKSSTFLRPPRPAKTEMNTIAGRTLPPATKGFRSMGGPGSGRYPRKKQNVANVANVTAREVEAVRAMRRRQADAVGSGAPQVLYGSRWSARRLADFQPPPEGFPWEKPGLSRCERVVAFLQSLNITSGTESGRKLVLRPFQMEFVRAVYDARSGTRAVRTAVLSLGRKNGKTQLAAALALCHLCGPEAESRGEIYSCANDRFQAAKIFSEMCAMIRLQPWLLARTNITQNVKQIVDLVSGSIYVALSREAKTKMGLSPSFVVYDELGQAPDDELYRAMDSAMGARAEPLLMVISTQAADDFAPMSRLIDYGLKINAGQMEDPAFHLTLYAANETDDPWSPATWKKANPALGDFRSLEDVQRQALQAQRMPAQENSFRNLILNMRVAAEARFIERNAWIECGGAAVIPRGARCYAAVDLGATRDMSALVLIHQDADGVFHVQPHYWLPGNVQARTNEDRVPYDAWVRQGLINAVGETTDPQAIALKIAELNGIYRIMTLAFDRWRIGDLQRELSAIGCSVQLVPHGQGYKDMGPAVDVLERFIIQKRIRHGNHPVLAMNAAHAVVTRDPAGSRKLDKAKSNGRIDGLVAAAMAFSIALIKGEKQVDITTMIV